MTRLMEARNITVMYGKVRAVSDVSLNIGPNEIVTVVGPNGAGKTSLLSALMGVIPHSGTLRQNTTILDNLPIHERFTRGLCLVPERRELFADMTVADNLLIGGFTRQRREGISAVTEREGVYALFPRLQERASQKASTLSGGERQMLALGRALMAKPKVLMLDEPSLGLAPLIIREMFLIIARLRQQGISILLVEQNARMALQIADYAYVMEGGRISLEGPADAIRKDPRVIESYLGIKGGADRTAIS